jgi:Holliday junction resolvase RusA-like endonuclease
MNDRLEFTGKPVAKPRMTRSDAWKKRPVVEKYWKFKDSINAQAKKQNFKLGRAYKVTFIVALPKSMSMKRKNALNGKPHMLRPDLDNMLKSLNDCLMEEDSSVHYIAARKIWGIGGKIIVENYPDNLDF